MTSRQPGTTPPGTAGPTEEPGSTGTPGRTRAAGTASHPPYAWALLLRLLPLTLLIIVGLAGLRGGMAAPKWDGPMQRDELAVGLAVEIVFAILIAIALMRTESGGKEPVAVKLRGVLIFVLAVGMVAVAVVTLVGLHLHLFSPKRTKLPTLPKPLPVPSKALPTGSQGSSSFHISAQILLYVLLIALLLAGVVLSTWWARRLRPPGRAGADDFIAEDPEGLREAVESGRSALRTLDDARAAIIACYLAMESSLADRGAVRGVADTPDELLARATETGLVRGTAATRLTALFYEARFSSHPLDNRQRDAAEQALDELAAALAEPRPASTGPARTGPASTGPASTGPASTGPAGTRV
jgi:Domain of unknown function (DUF4129)